MPLPSKAIKLLLASSILSLLIAPNLRSVSAAASPATLAVQPADIIQGDPVMIAIEGAHTSSALGIQISFGGKPLKVFMYKGKPTAFYGFDLKKKGGVYTVTAQLLDGTTLKKSVLVGERAVEKVSFTIPAKLGGNTTASQNALVSTLAYENASLVGLKTGIKAYWSDSFAYPLATTTITDSYGYNRATGVATVTHKGTDFRAPLDTEVMAINRGVVRLVQNTRNYGKTVVVDHGLGLMSFYMHLSKIYVNEGELVKKGQLVGLSGQTGYAEHPHLHLTIRVDDVSIDPARFLELFRGDSIDPAPRM